MKLTREQLKEERRTLLSRLSAIHDQYCSCMGEHPRKLSLTPYTADILGWEVGHKTPYYAYVIDITSMIDLFS